MSASHPADHVAITAKVQDRVMWPTPVVVVVVVVIVHVILSLGRDIQRQKSYKSNKKSAAGFHCGDLKRLTQGDLKRETWKLGF